MLTDYETIENFSHFLFLAFPLPIPFEPVSRWRASVYRLPSRGGRGVEKGVDCTTICAIRCGYTSAHILRVAQHFGIRF